MAAFGATYLAVAPINTESGSTITYTAGARVEHLRRMAITYNWDEGKLYGDNGLAEYYKHLVDADVEIETTELTPEAAVLMGLEVEKTAASGDDTPAVYTLATESGTPCGIGFVQCFIINGAKVFRGVWLHKVVLTPSNEESSTKEETINWGTPTVSGKVWPLPLGTNGEDQVRDFAEFATEAAAVAWVNGKAGITTTP